MAAFGSWTDHVHGPCTAVYTVCTWPWTAVYMGSKHGRVQSTRPCLRPVYRAAHVQGTWPGPCTGCVHDCAWAVYMVRPWPVHGRVRQCTLYTGVFTARVISRVRTVNMTVFRACLHGRVRCTRSCLRKVYTAVSPCTDHEHGCSRPAVYTARAWPCTR